MPRTLVEKILLAHTDADDVVPGEIVMVRCDLVMANDVSGPVAFRQMEKMGAERVFDPERVVMVADHFMPAKDVDTDTLYPGAYLNIDDPEQMKPYLFEGLDPTLRDLPGDDTILVVGENFGSGSLREHVVQGMKAWNIRCVLGKSFARIFYRNCVNLGLPAIVQTEAADAAEPGAGIRVDTEKGEIYVNDRRFETEPLPAFMSEMLSSGGLIAWGREKIGKDAG